jgi:hypothetical protein
MVLLKQYTGVGFQPDWVWIKRRSGATDNGLYDAVRGVTEQLESNNTDAETTEVTGLTAFGTDGFTVGALAQLNTSSATYVAWNWLGANTTVSNTDGSITSSVSANTTSGFSIVSYTGTGSAGTVGHGLGSAPKMVICKTRSTTGEWITWHTEIDIQAKLSLNTTDAVYNPGTGIYWNSTLPTSSVFSVGTSGSVNGSGTTYIAYCFAEKQGYSKFGSYTGNGDADGTFVYTGFKPAIVIVKSSSAVESWYTYDNKRTTSGGNEVDKYLLPNQNIAEGTFGAWDFLSNGFKARQNWSGNNSSGVTYIYMAFAENPFVTSTGVPATAR